MTATLTLISDPVAGLAFIPWFIEADQTRAQIGWELTQRLTDSPAETYCGVVTEGQFIVGILIGYLREKDAFVWQAHALPGLRGGRLIFEHFCQWARCRGVTQIATKSNRSARALARKYGFRKCGAELIKEL